VERTTAEDEDTATARHIAGHVSTQLLKTMFQIIATMADDPDGYPPSCLPQSSLDPCKAHDSRSLASFRLSLKSYSNRMPDCPRSAASADSCQLDVETGVMSSWKSSSNTRSAPHAWADVNARRRF
jgi:hypothetical protein